MSRLPSFAFLAIVLTAASAAAQEDLPALLEKRGKAIPRTARAFQETWLLPVEGRVAPGPDETRFGGRVHVYQAGPRERLEILRAKEAGLAEPVVVVSDGRAYWLVTAVGATPLVDSEAAGDPLIRMVLEGPAGDAPPYRAVAAEGGVAAVVLRHSEAREFDADRAFALELPRGGRGLLDPVSRFSAAGDAEVVASAGARGVERVQTASGTVSVTPDPAAVEWMEEEAAVPVVELERFKRAARLPPYDVLPPPVGGDATREGAGR